MSCQSICLLKDWENIAREDARITNPNRINEEANIVYISILRSILRGKKNILGIVYDMIDDKELHPDVVDCINDSSNRDISGKDKGYVLNGLWCAIEASLWKDPTYHSVIDWIINKKGDTDTNSAIAGAILGMRIGFDKMMEEKVTKENYEIMINSEFFNTRPKQYTLYDLDNLVDQASDLFLDSII